MKNKDKAVTTTANLTISKASEVLVNLTSKSATKKQSLTDLYLADFITIESESAAIGKRSALLVTFADLINQPFRTVTTSDDTTIIQVSSAWIKQHSVDDIKAAFGRYCNNGHLVNESIQKAFDSTFKRPSFLYSCPSCGITFEKSYQMRKELEQYNCKCGKSLKEFTITRN